MSTIMVTFILAFALIILAVIMLGISQLLTGKARFRIGSCGRVPQQKQDPDKGCGTEFTCSICRPNDEK